MAGHQKQQKGPTAAPRPVLGDRAMTTLSAHACEVCKAVVWDNGHCCPGEGVHRETSRAPLGSPLRSPEHARRLFVTPHTHKHSTKTIPTLFQSAIKPHCSPHICAARPRMSLGLIWKWGSEELLGQQTSLGHRHETVSKTTDNTKDFRLSGTIGLIMNFKDPQGYEGGCVA